MCLVFYSLEAHLHGCTLWLGLWQQTDTDADVSVVLLLHMTVITRAKISMCLNIISEVFFVSVLVVHHATGRRCFALKINDNTNNRKNMSSVLLPPLPRLDRTCLSIARHLHCCVAEVSGTRCWRDVNFGAVVVWFCAWAETLSTTSWVRKPIQY